VGFGVSTGYISISPFSEWKTALETSQLLLLIKETVLLGSSVASSSAPFWPKKK
jgi:hypothetical protein